MPGSKPPSARVRDRLRAAERELERQDARARHSLAEVGSSDSEAAPLAARLLVALAPRLGSPSERSRFSTAAASGHWRRA